MVSNDDVSHPFLSKDQPTKVRSQEGQIDGSAQSEQNFAGQQQTTLPRLSSEDLFRGDRQLVIVHGDQEYRLQLTRQGKLILTK